MDILSRCKDFAIRPQHVNLCDGNILIDSKFDDEKIDISISIQVSKLDYLRALEEQTKKGLAKYGKTIDECPTDALNWEEEALAEIIDGMIYLLQNEKKIAENN